MVIDLTAGTPENDRDLLITADNRFQHNPSTGDKSRQKESTLRRMTDSQNDFAYSQMHDFVNKSIKSNTIHEMIHRMPAQRPQGQG